MTFPPQVPGPAADLDLVGPWMTRQRWFANKGARPRLEEIGRWELAPEPGVRFVTHLLIDHAAGGATLYQVPLSYRDEPLVDVAPIGRRGLAWVYDAPRDNDYVAALLRMLEHGSAASGAGASALGERNPASVPFDADSPSLHSRVLSGEQSNTSIIVEWPGTGSIPVICKLFRALHHGENPDVELQGALAAAGSTAVPRAVGAIVAEWPDSGRADGRARGHLAFAQEFLPGAADAWRLALESASAGEDFTEPARRLGVTTATVHAMLARALPTREATASDIAETLDQMRRRLDAALREVPELEAHRAALEETLALASASRWPEQQRIHGDLHLGQVLDVPGRGWFVVDFEGEPLRPMAERSQLDSPLRDVAGMLRSFDYVAGALGVTAGVDAREWARASRLAFAEGYGEASGTNLAECRAVLDAFEADKALYEAVYEVRNRPEWLAIPVAAIERISARVPG
ncbi:putative trehalose synthase [Leifsonia sp. AK011]|uniref:maltokinase N-terminal cap-like domain-containing protein n=1 Tax=Leifsonia sp. AK011 TaxID=2723075 RepID=UPI0015CD46E8|nr:phosphotransferase [Leifsonia sp. AK011]NYF10422.1 putative trehalose synthase [Leifsonia sp. AK011]